jgi:hypothetical protein
MAMWTSFWLIVKVVTWDTVTKLAYQLVPIYHHPEIAQKLVSVVLATGNLFLQAFFQSLYCGFYDSSNLASAHCQSVVYYSVWIIYYRSSEMLFWMCYVSFLRAFRCKMKDWWLPFIRQNEMFSLTWEFNTVWPCVFLSSECAAEHICRMTHFFVTYVSLLCGLTICQ